MNRRALNVTAFRTPDVVSLDLHAYPQDHSHLLSRPDVPQMGVVTSQDGGEW